MRISISFNGDEYCFRDEEDNLLFVGNLSSIWLINGTKKKLSKPNGDIIANIKDVARIFLFKFYHEIIIDGTKYVLSKKWTEYFLPYNGVFYHFYLHKGRKVSIYRDEIQVGYMEYSSFYFSNNTFVTIILDNDSDVNLICSCIFAIVGNFESDDLANIYFGNWGKEKKPFDKDWIPKLV